jgi:hypothetical protein
MPNPVLMKHFRVRQVNPSILIITSEKPRLKRAMRAMSLITLSKAPVTSLSMMIPGVFMRMKLLTVICLRIVALMHVWWGRPNWNS